MTAKRTNFSLIAIVILLCLALVVGARMATSALSDQSQKLITLQLKQASLDNEQSQLNSAKNEINKYSSLATIAKSIVPQDKDQAEAVREIVGIAEKSSISLSSITFPKSDLGSTAPKAAANSKINLSQLTAVPGLSGVYELPITITSDSTRLVSFSQFISFLHQLENNRRTAQVTNVVLTPDTLNSSLLSFTLSINEYIKP